MNYIRCSRSLKIILLLLWCVCNGSGYTYYCYRPWYTEDVKCSAHAKHVFIFHVSCMVVYRLAQSQNGKRYFSAVYNDRDTEVKTKTYNQTKTAASWNANTYNKHISTPDPYETKKGEQSKTNQSKSKNNFCKQSVKLLKRMQSS